MLAGEFNFNPPTYEEIPQKLLEHRVISEDLRDRLRGLGGFRNILVHAYLEVDHDLLHEFLREDLDCFRAFADEIEEFLEE